MNKSILKYLKSNAKTEAINGSPIGSPRKQSASIPISIPSARNINKQPTGDNEQTTTNQTNVNLTDKELKEELAAMSIEVSHCWK